jgi:DNA modification methylase
VFDEITAARLDAKVGELETGDDAGIRGNGSNNICGEYDDGQKTPAYSDNQTGPSKYFYTSKANKSERTLDGKIENTHPTVKPVDLMKWLVKLATAEDQIVLDPFCGSGTTCRAAKDVNRRFIGIEKKAQWTDVARVRCGLTPENPAAVRSDDDQAGIEMFTESSD